MVASSLTASLENIDLTEVGGMMNQKLGEAMASVDMSESGAGLQEGIQNSLIAALEGIDLSESAPDNQHIYCNGPIINGRH